MRVLVFVLTLAGGLLPLLALVLAAVSARRRFRTLDEDLQQIRELIDRKETFEAMQAVRPASVDSWGILPWGPDLAERTFYRELARPAILAGLGIVAATAGGLLALSR